MALLIAGGGVYYMYQRGQTMYEAVNNQNTLPNVTSQNTEGNNAQMQSLVDLFTVGKNQKCEFSDGAGNSGQVYIANGKMRGDFSAVLAQGNVTSHMIVEDKVANIWIDGQSQGIKMEFQGTSEVTKQGAQNFDWDEKTNYNCTAWSVDASLFVLPKDITFSSIEDLIIPQIGQ